MRIHDVETFILQYQEPNDYNSTRMTVLIRVSTKDGVCGWGEAIAMWPEACHAVAALIREGMGQVIVGEDPLEATRLWHAMKKQAWWYGEGGIASMAIAGLDMAIWDLRGKLLGLPLYAMLGGKAVDALPAIASMHVNKPTMEEDVAEVVGNIEAGYQGAKLGFGKKGPSKAGEDPDYDIEFVAAVRNGMGPKPALMIDIGAGVSWDVATAVQTTRRMEESDIYWIEEPLHPDNLAGFAELRAKTSTRIATGEREFTPAEYARLVELGIIDVFGIDPARAEGITGFRKACEVIDAANATVNAHAWSSAVTTAASLHLSVSTKAAKFFELKAIPNPLQNDLVDDVIMHDGGMVKPFDTPGFGVEPKMSFIETHCV